MDAHRFDLVRPCVACPFGRGAEAVMGLGEDRMIEIVESEGVFACHKATDQACAGSLIHHLANQSEPQMMRIALRLRMFDPAALLKHESDAITDLEELLEAHK